MVYDKIWTPVSLTEHGLGDGEGDSRPAGHSPARGQVGKVSTQHLHNHPVIKGQVKLLVINKLPEKKINQGENTIKKIYYTVYSAILSL